MTKEQQLYSVLGAGFGPANLSLALTLEECGYSESTRFIERAPGFQWQDEQLLNGTDIQNNPFRDLVMPRNPHSPYSFVKYLHDRGQLTEYLHLNAKFPLRREYAGYLAWVARAFEASVDYGQSAARLSLTEHGNTEVFRLETDGGRQYLGKTFVLGTGRSPRIPAVFRDSVGPTVFHATKYLTSFAALGDRKVRVAVVGGSQSAIEIVLDLLERPNVEQVTSIQRGIGFRLKDTSPYSRRFFLPEFVDYFHPLPLEAKRRIRAELRTTNYAACDHDVIDRLALVQREYELMGSDRLRMKSFTEVAELLPRVAAGAHRLVVRDVNYGTRSSLDVDVVILATGFRDFDMGPEGEPYHPLLEGIADRMPLLEDGTPDIARDYSIELKTSAPGADGPRLYVNGLCESSHGMGDSGTLAILSARAADITESIMRGPARAETDRRAVVEALR